MSLLQLLQERHSHRDLIVGDTFQDRRQPGHQDAAPEGSPTVHQLLRSSQPVPAGDLLDDGPLPNCTIRDTVITERDKAAALRSSKSLGNGHPALHGLSPRRGLGRKP